jgi:hypothetical protein
MVGGESSLQVSASSLPWRLRGSYFTVTGVIADEVWGGQGNRCKNKNCESKERKERTKPTALRTLPVVQAVRQDA